MVKVPSEMGPCFLHLNDLIQHSCISLGITHAMRIQNTETGFTRQLSMAQNGDLLHVMLWERRLNGLQLYLETGDQRHQRE